MPETNSPERDPAPSEEKSFLHKNKDILGIVSRGYQNFIVGADAGYTIIKAGIVLGLGSAGAALLHLPIIAAGFLGGGLFMFTVYQDEKERRRAKAAKEAETSFYKAKNDKATEDYLNALKTLRNDSPAVPSKPIDINVDVASLSNEQLLKLTIAKYFERLQLLDLDNQKFELELNKRRRHGVLPGQEGIIKLIEVTTGFSRNDPLFAAKVAKFLNSHFVPGIKSLPTPDEFVRRVAVGLNLRGSNNIHVPVNIEPVEKPSKTVIDRVIRFIKNGMFFTARTNTALGLVIGSMLISGMIAIVGTTVVVGWPILLVGAVMGLLSGIATIVYNRYIAKYHKTENEQLSKELNDSQTKNKLLHKLQRIRSKRPLSGLDLEDSSQSKQPDSEPSTKRAPRLLTRNRAVPASTKGRMWTHFFSSSSYGFFVGMVIGIAITSMILIISGFIPPAGFLLALLALKAAGMAAIPVGATFGARYGWILGKSNYKANLQEQEEMKQVAKLTKDYKHRLGDDTVERYLSKSRQELIVELMKAYIKLNMSSAKIINNLKEKPEDKQQYEDSLASKKEKILQLIEESTGKLGEPTRVQRNRNSTLDKDAEFFDNLAKYLLRYKSTHKTAIEEVNQFKKALVGDQAPEVGVKASSIIPNINKEEQLSLASKRITKHVIPILCAVGIAIPLAFMLFGASAVVPFVAPVVIPLLIVATIVTIAYTAQKICERRATVNKENLAETADKLPLIESIIKTNAKSNLLSRDREPDASATATDSRRGRISPQSNLSHESQQSPSPHTRNETASRPIPEPPTPHIRESLTGIGRRPGISQSNASPRFKLEPKGDGLQAHTDLNNNKYWTFEHYTHYT